MILCTADTASTGSNSAARTSILRVLAELCTAVFNPNGAHTRHTPGTTDSPVNCTQSSHHTCIIRVIRNTAVAVVVGG